MSADTMLKFSYLVIFLKLFNLTISDCLEDTYRHSPLTDIKIGESIVQIGPQFTKNGLITLYTLNEQGVFHRCTPTPASSSGEIAYSVLKNGLLIPHQGPYAITYTINKHGDLIPKSSNDCIYKSDKHSFYLKGTKKILIPVEIFYSGDEISYIFGHNHVIYTEPINKSVNSFKFLGITQPKISLKLKPENSLVIPDKSCSGDIILFLLKSNGVLARNPPDEYLPNGMKLKYELKDDGSLRPSVSKNPESLKLTYITSENGNLKPCQSNTHILTTFNETTKSFILGEGGVIAPVSEVMLVNKSINYFYDGKLIHSSNQFKKMYSNASLVYVTEKSRNLSRNQIQSLTPDPKLICSSKSICKRDTSRVKDESNEPNEDYHRSPPFKSQCQFAYDDHGKRIPLEPFMCENGKIALFKLTCKGHLKRMLPHSEPECNFDVYFKILNNFIMVPISKGQGSFQMKYTLKENGSLAPVKNQKNTFKKAPASVVYYLLLKHKQLLPVRLHKLKCNHIEIFYQDCLIHTMSPDVAKNLDIFTTLYTPMYAYCNGRVVIIYADPIPKCAAGATWHNPTKSHDDHSHTCQNLYLVGPNKTKSKIEIELNKNGVPCVYELDWNGVCHRSPKDDNKNMILRCYKFIKNGIWCPSNDSNGYIFLVDKQGDMLPYCYPESKLRAPQFLTVKYVLCKGGMLLPILVEACAENIRFSFDKHVIYFKKAYTLEEVIELSDDTEIMEKNDDVKFFKEKCGSYVYYQKIGECLHRHPSQKVEEYLINQTGYLQILTCGSLQPMTYPVPGSPYIKVMLLQNGDLDITGQHGGKVTHEYFLLTDKGSLYSVKLTTNHGYYEFYKHGKLVAKQKQDKWQIDDNHHVAVKEEDIVDIIKDVAVSSTASNEPHHINIPVDYVKECPKNKVDEYDKDKCQHIQKMIKDMISKDKTLLNSEMLMNEEVQKKITNMVSCCSKIKDKRSINLINYKDENHSLDEEKC